MPDRTGFYERTYNCKEWLDKGYKQSGWYLIDTPSTTATFWVYCDMVSDGGGWLVCTHFFLYFFSKFPIGSELIYYHLKSKLVDCTVTDNLQQSTNVRYSLLQITSTCAALKLVYIYVQCLLPSPFFQIL